MSHLKTKNNSLSATNEISQARSTQLAQQLQESEATRTKLTQVNAKQKAKISLLSTNVSDLQAKLSDTVSQTAHFTSVHNFESQISELRAHISELESEIETRSREHSKQSELVISQTSMISSLESQLSETLQQLAISQESVSALQTQITDITIKHTSDLYSLESHNAIAISLSEQQHNKITSELRSTISLQAKQINVMELKLRKLESDVQFLKTQLIDQDLSLIRIHASTESSIPHSTTFTQSDPILALPTISQTLPVHILSEDLLSSITSILHCSTCNRKWSTISTLFPCGHGVCEDCLSALISNDKTLAGFTCAECKNNLPITRISLNYPLIKLANLFRAL